MTHPTCQEHTPNPCHGQEEGPPSLQWQTTILIVMASILAWAMQVMQTFHLLLVLLPHRLLGWQTTPGIDKLYEMEIITKNLLSRFSPSDWSASNIDHYNSADSSRNQSERIRNEAIRLIREREDKTTLTQRDCDRRVGERLHDEVNNLVSNIYSIGNFLIQTFWRSELQSELERNVNETHHLETTRKNLERALAETEGPMRVNAECIYNR